MNEVVSAGPKFPAVKREPEARVPAAPSRCFGLFNRKERWGLSRSGWLTGITLGLAMIVTLFFGVRPFLAVTSREETAKILVVEGWVHDFALDAAVKEFTAGAYRQIFVTGGPVDGQGGYINDFHTYASIGAEKLKQRGLSTDLVQMTPSHIIGKDRTYYSAVALRNWFREHHLSPSSINVLTQDAHARRTRDLFQEAFGKQVKVGIISVHNPDYDPAYWWCYSDGVRDVISESIAYIYAKFFFWPRNATS
jgi:hypothetical protein